MQPRRPVRPVGKARQPHRMGEFLPRHTLGVENHLAGVVQDELTFRPGHVPVDTGADHRIKLLMTADDHFHAHEYLLQS